MRYEGELNIQLAKEMAELWFECKIKCERIEEIIKQIKDIEKI